MYTETARLIASSKMAQTRYQYSTPIPPESAAKMGSFTTLPIHRHKHDRIANQATREFMKEWAHVSSGRKYCVYTSQSSVGHIASLMAPECLPERLPAISNCFDYFSVEDDSVEFSGSDEERTAILDEIHYGYWTDPSTGKPRVNPGYREFQFGIFNSLDWNRPTAQSMVRSMIEKRSIWMASRTGYKSLDEYMELRLVDTLTFIMDDAMALITDIEIDNSAKESIAHITKPLKLSMVLSNDYFSYWVEKAYHQLLGKNGVPFNAVSVLMAQDSIDEEAALNEVKQRIIAYEKEHSLAFEALHKGNTIVSENVNMYLHTYRLAVAGSHLWHAAAYRYQAKTADDAAAILNTAGAAAAEEPTFTSRIWGLVQGISRYIWT